jgi:trehalose-phosphatase
VTAPPAPADPTALAARLLGRPGLILLDVDGTLAPIAPRPEDARVPAPTLEAVARLTAAPGTHVALVSGRAPDDARRMVPVPGLWAIGNHGAEAIAPDGTHAVHPAVACHAIGLRGAAADLLPLGALPGVRVEDKRWSLSVHVRQARPADVPAVEQVVADAAAHHGLRLGRGKAVYELKAPGEVHKGTAALALAERLGATAPGAALCFVGDDVTDEDGFRHLRAAAPHAVTVRVGPPEIETAAESVLPDPAAVCALLAAIATARGG